MKDVGIFKGWNEEKNCLQSYLTYIYKLLDNVRMLLIQSVI